MLNSLFIGNQDGGIINTITQAPQSDEPVVIVGLGGTGVDAVTRLKTKLHRQIQPDNKDAVESKGEEPRYDHIKFLGIDADKGWLESSGLTQGETLNIQNYGYNVIFAPEKLDALKRQKDMQWMSIDYMSNHLPPAPDGAGAYRQFGRWLTISSANTIKMKLTQVITQACSGRNGGGLIVHIVSGISGGMGAGSFVDICYIAQDVLHGLGFSAAKVFGYFVLPDAIISKDGIIGDPVKTAANQKNGMASLLEIEHLMNLEDSNEWFEQDYGSFKIRTQKKLVDMCHFVSATNMNGVPVPNGYEYALNVIGDYILAFISKEQVANGANPITMTGNLTNIDSHVNSINPENHGYSQNYHVIGSANAEIPTAQMATYLASQLFEKLTISPQMPNNLQIDQEFADYLKLSDSYFKQLENQMAQGTAWEPITVQLVKQYFDQIKAHMNDNILPAAMVNPTEFSLKQRRGLMLQNRGTMGKKVDQYVYQAGASSIPGLALNKLIEIAEDPVKGPIYAYGMMNKTGADIFHYLNGRKKYYAQMRQDARNNEASFTNREPAAKRDLGNSNLLNKKEKIRMYAETLNSIYYWQAQGDLFEEMEILMADLINTFQEMNQEYLKPLYETTQDLIETFQANSNYFELGKGDQSQDGFAKQLVKFSHIQPELDTEIVKLDPRIETAGILKILTDNPDIWMGREELKLKAKISEYILTKFHPILSGSLESFLRKDLKMLKATNSAFVNAIEANIIVPFVNTAAPVFWTNDPMVSDNAMTAHRTILTVPSAANCVCQAANNYKKSNDNIEIRQSLINDRVYILRTISGIPMHAYQGLTQYLGAYTGYSGLGLHLYEHDVNWREILTFPYPYSDVSKYTKNAEELLKLYDDAEKRGVIYYQGTNAYVRRLHDAEPEQLNVDTVKKNGKFDMGLVNQRINELNEILQNPKEPLPINSKGNQQGNTIVKDNFLRFYGIQQAVKEEVGKYDSLMHAIEEIKQAVEESDKKDALQKVFFDSVLTEIFEDDGFNMAYQYVQFGMQKTVVLCDNSMPFSGLSKYYQAFQSMAVLDDFVLSEITEKANTKFNEMSTKDKVDRINKLMGMYNPQVLSRISANYEGKQEQKDIDSFYAAFIQYLDDLHVQLMMTGAV